MKDPRARDIHGAVEAMMDEMVAFLSGLISRPSVGPSSGGEGEWDRVKWIEERARAIGLDDVERFDVDDPTVPSGKRPNLVVWLRSGQGHADGPRLLVVTHTDVVPPGNLDDWTGDPFLARVE
ncbi:MAG: hypothetical protein KAJ35_06445, partial [Thermoplasmata archaeon]|nr:hypothetical protein [Thermoplasmata archaeon]